MLVDNFDYKCSDNVTVNGDLITVDYTQHTTKLERDGEKLIVTPVDQKITFRTNTKVPKVGLMLVGIGGNNGTTVVTGVLANQEKLSWETRSGTESANYFGSVAASTTIKLGELDGEPVFAPFNKVAPLVHPNDFELDGWDISGMNLYDASKRAQVVEPTLREQLADKLRAIVPRRSIYDPTFIAENQRDRADNLITGTRQEQLEQVRADIRDFKASKGLDKVVILWTATTERFADIVEGLNDTWANLEAALKENKEGIAPSTIFAAASLLEGCPFINGSPQNTLVPGIQDLARITMLPIGGDDFKSGQTKMKSVLMEYLTDAGLKPASIVSYNHLGNNDGRNLSSPAQFRSKEISKSNVVTDMVTGNEILYPKGSACCANSDSALDHCVVIKYVPYVGDSKRALDEYTSEIFLGGKNTIVMHNTCEDSLLAAPIILDLAIFTEFITRVEYSLDGEEFKKMDPVTAILAYFTKAPLPPQGHASHVVNALSKQRLLLENFVRITAGFPAETHSRLQHLVQLDDAY